MSRTMRRAACRDPWRARHRAPRDRRARPGPSKGRRAHPLRFHSGEPVSSRQAPRWTRDRRCRNRNAGSGSTLPRATASRFRHRYAAMSPNCPPPLSGAWPTRPRVPRWLGTDRRRTRESRPPCRARPRARARAWERECLPRRGAPFRRARGNSYRDRRGRWCRESTCSRAPCVPRVSGRGRRAPCPAPLAPTTACSRIDRAANRTASRRPAKRR